MNWDAIGAVAEVVGAFAVVLSVLYLAIQVRHARRSTDSATYQVIQSNLATAARSTAESPEVVSLFKRALDGEVLSAIEDLRLQTLLSELTYQFEDLFFLYENGDLAHDLFMNHIENSRQMFEAKYYQNLLFKRRGNLSSRFRDFAMRFVAGRA